MSDYDQASRIAILELRVETLERKSSESAVFRARMHEDMQFLRENMLIIKTKAGVYASLFGIFSGGIISFITKLWSG